MSSEFRITFPVSPDSVLYRGRAVPEYLRRGGGQRGGRGGDDSPEFRRGFEAGKREWGRGFSGLLEGLEGELAALGAYREELRKGVEESVVDLALASAQKLLQQEIEGGRCRLAEMVHRVLGSLGLGGEGDAVRVRMHPADLDRIESGIGGAERAGPTPRVTLAGDDSLERGEFVVESRFGEVTWDLPGRIRELRAYLTEGEGQ